MMVDVYIFCALLDSTEIYFLWIIYVHASAERNVMCLPPACTDCLIVWSAR
jgi:hypothetical protein